MNKSLSIKWPKYRPIAAGLLFAAVLMFSLTSCSKTTSPPKTSLSGTVLLTNDTADPDLDPVDLSGITVALYYPAILDTSIVNINNQHPNIGIQIDQLTEFDHRLLNAVLTVSTSADGSFNFSSISPGTYNLVAFKNGWGVHYLYGIQIVEGENTLPSAMKTSYGQSKDNPYRSDIELFPVVQLSGYVNAPFEFLSNHNYIIPENLTFTGDVVFYPGSQIWVNPAKKISFYATITTPDDSRNFVRISTSASMYSTIQQSASTIQKFYNLDCSNQASFGQNKLSSVITTFSELGWAVNTSAITISNMIFRHVKTGLVMQQLDSVEVSHCNLQNSIDTELGCMSLISCTNISTSNLVVNNCTTGIRQHSSTDVDIYNCYFYNSSIADIDNLYETTGSVTHCTFVNSAKGVATSGTSNTLIEYCLFQNTIGIHNFHQLNWNRSWFTAHYNNFYCSEYNAMSTAVFTLDELIHMDALNNYWGTTSTEIMQEKIYDYYDLPAPDPNHPNWTIWAVIDYAPYRTSAVPNAGVEAD